MTKLRGQYEYIASPNFSERSKSITALIIHYTASMGIDSPISWFKDRRSKVSAHYVIGRDGRVVQMVPEDKVAWHAGRSAMDPYNEPPKELNVNSFSIGIELVGTMDSGFTDKQLAALYDLAAHIVADYKIPPERVVGHLHIAPGRKIDPDGTHKQFPWAKLKDVCNTAYVSSKLKTDPLNA